MQVPVTVLITKRWVEHLYYLFSAVFCQFRRFSHPFHILDHTHKTDMTVLFCTSRWRHTLSQLLESSRASMSLSISSADSVVNK